MRLRHLMLLSASLGFIALGGFSSPATSAPVRDEAFVDFARPVLVGDSWVMGPAIVVHDDELKARDEPCTSVYLPNGKGPAKLVTSFYCERVDRPAADRFRIVTRRDNLGMNVLTEFQFRGQPHAHKFAAAAGHSHSGH